MVKVDYLLRFRRAKTEPTLDIMYERMMAKAPSPKVKADIVLAKCQRERELELNRLLSA